MKISIREINYEKLLTGSPFSLQSHQRTKVCMLKCRNDDIIIYFLLLILPVVLYSQVDTAWIRRYNGPDNNDDVASSIAVDNQGNVYVTGFSMGSGTSYDYATIKYNSAGDTAWVRRYNGQGNDWDKASAIVVDGSGNVYVTGFSMGSGTNIDYTTIKYNSAGVAQWVQRYNGSANSYDDANAIAVDDSDNIYVTGYSASDSIYPYNFDYATIKYNSVGDSVWVRRYNGPGNDYDVANAIAVDGSGNVYVTGNSIGSGTSNDFATIKYDSAGVPQWVVRYDGPGNGAEWAYAIAVDDSGNVYVTGESYVSGTSADYATIKYNSAGVQQWVQRYNGPGNSYDGAYAIVVDHSGNLYVTGWSHGLGTSNDYATIKYNPAGVQEWAQRYNGPGNLDDVAYAIANDDSDNVYVTGESFGSGTDFDYATIKYNSAGVQQWVQRYDGPGNWGDYACAIAVNPSGNVYVTGSSVGSGTSNDFATIKYVQTSGIEEIGNCKLKFENLSVFPNPATILTTIRYLLSAKSKVSLQLFNISGRLVKTLVNQEKNTGNYSLIWNGTDDNNRKVGEGIYFCILKTEQGILKQKILLVR
jgi:uncharacterized delta-60 repeat protein